jgi:ABC-type uncharacterized transport system fused permease/ATPase subunit
MGALVSTLKGRTASFGLVAVALYFYRQHQLEVARLQEEEEEFKDENKHVVSGRYGTFNTSGNIEEDFKAAKKKRKGTSMQHVELLLKMVWPSFFSSGEEGNGKGWVLAIGGLVVGQTLVMAQVAKTHSALNAAIHSRSSNFKSLLMTNVVLAFGQTFFTQTMELCVQRLALVWRSKLTLMLHEDYFKNMSFYHLVHQAGERKLGDPDQRIANDVASSTLGMAQCLHQGLLAVCTGLYFTSELYNQLGPVYAVAPYAFFFSGIWWTDRVCPLDWRKLVGTMEFVFSNYRSGHTRLLMHSEAICALKGEDAERQILTEQLAKTEGVQRRFWEALVPFQFVNGVAFREGMQFFSPTMILAAMVFGAPRPGAGLGSMTQAEVMATVTYRIQIFSQSMMSAGLFGQGWQLLKRLSGNAARVTKLMSTLDEMGAGQVERHTQSFEQGDYIEFKNVQVVTPTGVQLVEDLSFRLDVGGSLMITGHNGAGKSSIFRCLGGLWNVPKGKIVKPGGKVTCGLHQDIFYLPQKPYNVLGTLIDQLTYPQSGGSAITKTELSGLLSKVDLGYLADRPGVLVDEINWEDELSLGEKQRLAMARLMYHKPRFAILDECTSAVSGEMELRLFKICRKLKITYITISHRPALQQFHDRILAIGDGKSGFTITDVPDSIKEQAKTNSKGGSVDDDDELQGTRGRPEDDTDAILARSVEYKPLAEKREVNAKSGKLGGESDLSALHKFIALMRVSLPSDWPLKFAFAFGAIAVRTAVANAWMIVYGGMVSNMLQRSQSGFLAYCGLGALWVCAGAGIERACEFAQRTIGTDLRMSISHHLLAKYFKTRAYFRLKNLDGTMMDPETRLTDEVRSFALTSSEIITDFAKPLADIVWFSVALRSITGTNVMVGLWAYTIVGIGMLKYIMPDYKKIVAAQTVLDGKFKFEHARVRMCSESIAFFGGDQRELSLLNSRYKQVEELKIDTLWKEWGFNLLNHYFIEKLPENINFMAQEHAVSASKGAGSAVNVEGARDQVIIQKGVEKLFEAFGKLLAFGPKVATLTGYINRIHELMYQMELLEQQMEAEQEQPPTESEPAETESSLVHVVAQHEESMIRLNAVDLVTPKGVCMAKDISLTVECGRSLMVTGPNACGKSSLFRVLGGLWPLYASSRARSSAADGVTSELLRPKGKSGGDSAKFEDIFLVPQRMYMADGTLADQVTYPRRITREDRTPEAEAKMFAQLELVGIHYLVERNAKPGPPAVSGWDAKCNWEDVLSLGEQQRMGMARLFYHSPSFAVLDECTSAVSVDVEERMYKTAHEKKITCITISQRLALEQWHSAELKLGENTPSGWALKEIAK